MTEQDVIVIGSGPAGLTAAIYLARANLSPLVISGTQPGGQLMMTTEVENYPGFPEGILGPELMKLFRAQAERFGTQIIDDAVASVDFAQKPFKVKVGATEYTAKAIIVATGASALWLGLPNEQQLVGRGISACATCDGFFFRNKEVAVIGGGDTAMEEATYLSKFAKTVTVIHRRDTLKASQIMQDKAKADPKISFIWNHTVEEIVGTDRLTGLKIKNVNTGEITEKSFDGMFVAIGHKPNTEIFREQIELDVKGYVKVHDSTKTNVDGVFTAGDVHDHHYRQAVTAAGFGAMAALDVEKYLNHK